MTAPLATLHADPDWQALPKSERDRIRLWVALLAGVRPPGVTRQLHAIAARMGVAYPTARRYLSGWQRTQDWRAVLDRRRLAGLDREGTGDPGFRAYWGRLVADNQRSTRAARRTLLRLWAAKSEIPGYDGWPGWPEVPTGWSEANLTRLIPPRSELTIIRRGIKAAAPYLPQVLRTRVGLWPGSHIQMDDVWHDHYVRFGVGACRILEFGALDVWSGCRYAYGTKPRRAKPTGGHEGLTERDFRFFVASVLWNTGWSPRGTVLMLERGTAALRESVAGLLHDATGGLITVETGAMHGQQQALLGDWAGRAGGSGNFKSHLESLHNLIHNELAALPGQTGKDRQSQKESTYGIVRYQERLLQWAATMPPELTQHLKHPLLDYHSEFLPLLRHIYDTAINGRTDHDLEGWAQLHRIVTRYTIAPGSGHWLDIDDIPPETRPLISSAAAADPARWTQRHRMSPAEVWRSGCGDLIRAPHTLIADLLGPDCAIERQVEGSYIEIRDAEIDPAPLIYESRVATPDGRQHELRRGERYACFPNPYAPDTLLICDAAGRCLGMAQRVRRVCLADREAMEHAWGRAAHRRAEILEPVRQRHAPDEEAAVDLRRHNAELGFPGAPGRNGGRAEAAAARSAAESAAAKETGSYLEGLSSEGDDWLEDGTSSPYRG